MSTEPMNIPELIDDQPHDDEAEKLILGVVLKMGDDVPGMVAELVTELSADDFYRPTHKQIWKAIQRLQANRETVDFLTVTRSIQQTNQPAQIAYISSLLDGVPMYRRASALTPHVQLLK